jgi:hypothetical protein
MNHRKLMKDNHFPETAKQHIKNFTDDRKRMDLNAHLWNHKGKEYEYKRLVTVFNRDKTGEREVIDKEVLLIDQIELNSRLHDLRIENELQEFSDLYILFSYSVLYSFICPVLSCIIFIFNLVSRKWTRLVHLHYLKR